MSLNLAELRTANIRRIPTFRNAKGELTHNSTVSDWSIADWFTAMVGEVGELGNVLKKIRRGDFDLTEDVRIDLGKECADILIYLDLLAIQLGVDLAAATRQKFNEVSDRVGSPIKLSEPY